MSDTGVAELAKMSTGLTYLNISRCERVGEYGDRALIQLGRSCHQLKGLDAFGCSHAQVERFPFLCLYLHRLLTRAYISDRCVRRTPVVSMFALALVFDLYGMFRTFANPCL